MCQVTKRALEASLKTAAAGAAAGQDHRRRHRGGLRHQPHDLLLPLPGHLRPGGVEPAIGGRQNGGYWRAQRTYDHLAGGVPPDLWTGLLDNRPFITQRVPLRPPGAGGDLYLFQRDPRPAVGRGGGAGPAGDERARRRTRPFMADFYKYAFVGLVLDWIRTGMKGEPAELARRVELVVSGSFAQALERLRADSAHQAGPFDQN